MASKNTTPENWIDESSVILDLKKLERKQEVTRPYSSKYISILDWILWTRYGIYKLDMKILDKQMTLRLDYFNIL